MNRLLYLDMTTVSTKGTVPCLPHVSFQPVVIEYIIFISVSSLLLIMSFAVAYHSLCPAYGANFMITAVLVGLAYWNATVWTALSHFRNSRDVDNCIPRAVISATKSLAIFSKPGTALVPS